MHTGFFRLKLVVSILLVLLMVAACTAAPTTVPSGNDNTAATDEAATDEAATQEGDTGDGEESVLRIAFSGTISTFDPIRSVAGTDITVLGQLYSRLLRIGADG